MPPRDDPPLHPLDLALQRVRAAPLMSKPAAAEAAVAELAAWLKGLERRVAELEDLAPRVAALEAANGPPSSAASSRGSTAHGRRR